MRIDSTVPISCHQAGFTAEGWRRFDPGAVHGRWPTGAPALRTDGPPQLELLLSRHGSIRAFGEMVDLLWRDGRRQATIALERLWNELLVGLPVEPLCGYHLDGFTSSQDLEAFQGICRAHAQIHPTDVPTVGRGLEITSFQQQAMALSAEVTERRRAQRSLEQATTELARANVDLRRLLHVASHDLQEPLRRSSLHLDLLRNDGEDLDARDQKHLAEAIHCLEVMRQRVAAMRSLAEIVDSPPQQQCFPAEAAVRTALRRLDAEIDATGASIRTARLPKVIGNQDQLIEVFWHLIDNALVHRGDQPPEIRIAVQDHDEALVFSVADNGVGIPVEQRSQVFQLFARLGDKASGHVGAGLGLVKKIVERHGGEIWIDQATAVGTRVCFSWPSDRSEAKSWW